MGVLMAFMMKRMSLFPIVCGCMVSAVQNCTGVWCSDRLIDGLNSINITVFHTGSSPKNSNHNKATNLY